MKGSASIRGTALKVLRMWYIFILFSRVLKIYNFGHSAYCYHTKHSKGCESDTVSQHRSPTAHCWRVSNRQQLDYHANKQTQKKKKKKVPKTNTQQQGGNLPLPHNRIRMWQTKGNNRSRPWGHRIWRRQSSGRVARGVCRSYRRRPSKIERNILDLHPHRHRRIWQRVSLARKKSTSIQTNSYTRLSYLLLSSFPLSFQATLALHFFLLPSFFQSFPHSFFLL